MPAPVRDDRARCAVVIEFPALDGVLDPYRIRLDPSRALGVPAHVTLLYPFLPPQRLDESAWRLLGEAVSGVPPFDVVFSDTDWFGRDVLWLAPTPSEPLSELTARICAAFPALAPYGGGVDDPVPHLTIADRAGTADMEAADAAVKALLPLAARVGQVSVLAGTRAPDSWGTVGRLSLPD